MDQDGNAIAGIFFLSLEDFLSSSDYHRLQELVKAVGPVDTMEIISRFPRRETRENDHGEYYTPDYDVDFMSRLAIAVYLERAGTFKGFKEMRHPAFQAMFDPPSLDQLPHKAMAAITEHLERAKVLDPACGAGVFLSRILDISLRLLNTIKTRNGHENDKDLERNLNLARSMLHGIDINVDALVATKMSIAWTLAVYHQATKETMHHILETIFGQDMNLLHADFLLQEIESLEQFDIIIGNPPYIRQESITLPGAINFHQETPVLRDRRAYKARIEEILEPIFTEKRLPSRMSDYYVYFFFKAIPLLREGGCLSFLVSKSWLDAKFGKQLREAIASDVMIDFIIDPGEKRFDQAEINTLVVACSKPQLQARIKGSNKDGNDENSLAIGERYVANNVARFIRFLSPMAGIDLLTKAMSMLRGTPVHQGGSLPSMAKDIVKDPISRVFPVHQGDLMPALASRGSNRRDDNHGLISGSWKAAFLNGEDVFYKVLDELSHVLVPLKTLARVRSGCYSGINAFFYLDAETIKKFRIEKDYLQPLIRNHEDITRLVIDGTSRYHVLTIPPVSKGELEQRGHLGVKNYIEWGESQVTTRGQKTNKGIPWPKVSSVRNRKQWYSLPPTPKEPSRMFMQYIAHDRFYCPASTVPVVPDRCFHRIFTGKNVHQGALLAILNSTLQAFLAFSLGRTSLGGGALKIETRDAKSMMTIDVRVFNQDILERFDEIVHVLGKRRPESIFKECGVDPSRHIGSQDPTPLGDRAMLDALVGDALDLDSCIIAEIQRAACRLVKKRLLGAKIRDNT